jgi:hypothetical protein
MATGLPRPSRPEDSTPPSSMFLIIRTRPFSTTAPATDTFGVACPASAAKERRERARIDAVMAGGHPCGDVADLLEAPPVERVLAVRESILGNCRKRAHPGEPWSHLAQRLRHGLSPLVASQSERRVCDKDADTRAPHLI